MSASTLDLLQSYEQSSAAKPVKIKPYPEQPSDENHEDVAMTKQEEAELRELVHNVAASVALLVKVQSQPAQPQGTKWFMAAIASITILGAAGSFVGNSGMWVGKSQTDFQHQVEQVKELKEEVGYLKTWNEKLRNNMAAYGWLVDIDGNVSRIEEKPRRR